MSFRPILAVVLLFFLGAWSLQAVEIIDPSELRVGEEGYFVTEIDGGELLKSPVRIMGVLGASMPGGELVLIRLLAPRFEKSGVAAGMSGSPVYVRGRLVGALAFAWAFASEPIAGVTPFARMEGDLPAETSEGSGGGELPGASELAAAVRDGQMISLTEKLLRPQGSEGPSPLPFSIGAGGALSSFRPEGWLGKLFQRMGWVLAPGGAGTEAEASRGEIRPGSMVAAVLVDGDAHLAAGGTVTEIRGDRVWAFGHPFLGAGSMKMPMARATVVTILPSLANSFKFFNTGGEIGSFLSDRRHGIWGRMGRKSSTVPFHLNFGDESFDFGLIDHEVLTPLLAAYLVQGIQSIRGVSLIPQSIGVSLAIDFEDGRDLRLDQVFEGGDAPAQAAAWTGALVAYLRQSSFEAPEMKKISCTLTTREGLRRRQILDVSPSSPVLAPHQEFRLRIRLLAPDGRIEKRVIEMKAPGEGSGGHLQLVVADGASWAAYDLKSRPGLVHSFSGQLELLRRLRSAGTIVAAFEGAGRSLVTESGSVPIPAGVLMNLKSGRRTQMKTVGWRVQRKLELPVDFPVLGAMRIKLKLRAPGFEKGE